MHTPCLLCCLLLLVVSAPSRCRCSRASAGEATYANSHSVQLVFLYLLEGAAEMTGAPAAVSLQVKEDKGQEVAWHENWAGSDKLSSSASACVSALLRSDTPRLLFGRPDGRLRQDCIGAGLPAFASAVLIFDDHLAEAFEAFGRVGEVQVAGTSLGQGVLQTLKQEGRQPMARQVRLEICMPLECEAGDLHFALYLIWLLRFPGNENSALELLNQRTPIYSEGVFERLPVKAPGVAHDRARFRRTVGPVVDAVIKLDRLHAALRSHVDGLIRAREQMPRWQALLAERGQQTGLKGSPLVPSSYNRLLVYAYQTQAHAQNPFMEFGVSDQLNEERLGALEIAADASDALSQRLLVAGAEMGIPAFVKEAAASTFSLQWPIWGKSRAERVFQGSVHLPVYRLHNVCVRDLTPETDFLDVGGSISSGRRLELITVGLLPHVVEELEHRPLLGRFVTSHLTDTHELAFHLVGDFAGSIGRPVVALPGSSLLLYDGHKLSARCPDCANIEHALVDDLLLELAAWYLDGGVAESVVLNLHGSIGEVSPKVWFESLVRSVVGDVAPIVDMQPGNTICFERVTINFHPCPYLMEDEEAPWQANSLQHGLQMSRVLAWVRERVWAAIDGRGAPLPKEIGIAGMADAVGAAFQPSPKFVMFARQSVDGMSVKRRHWVGYDTVARQLGAKVIDFGGLSFADEVRAMRSAEVFVTVPGAHHAAALFMRPGSVWVELQCTLVSTAFYWYRGFRRLLTALGVHFVPVEAEGCPTQTALEDLSSDQGQLSVPAWAHPVRIFAWLAGLDLTVSEWLVCSWRRLTSNIVAVELNGSAGVRPLGAATNRQHAMIKCMRWENDCQCVRKVAADSWELLRVAYGSSDGMLLCKHACAERHGNWARLVDRTAIVPHRLYDGDLQAPSGLASYIRCAIPGHGICSRPWNTNVGKEQGLLTNWLTALQAHAISESNVAEPCWELHTSNCECPGWLHRACAWVLADHAFSGLEAWLPDRNFSGLDSRFCDAIPAEFASKGAGWIQQAESIRLPVESDKDLQARKWKHGQAEADLEAQLEARARSLHRIADTLHNKLWAMTQDEEAEFAGSIQHLRLLRRRRQEEDDKPVKHVCIDGVTASSMESLCFIHFAWGHFIAVLGALARAGLLGRPLRLTFTHQRFLCPPSSWLAYYGLISDELPRYVSECEEGLQRLTLKAPIHVHYEDPSSEEGVNEHAWRAHLDECQLRPQFHPLVVARLGLSQSSRDRSFTITWLRKGLQGAVSRSGEEVSSRDVLNAHEVRKLLISHARKHGARLLESSFDGLAWHEQMAIVAKSDVWLAVHGSAVAAHEPYLRSGSVAIEVLPAGTCHCPYAFCAAANSSRDFAWVLATTPGVDCNLGAWVGKALKQVPMLEFNKPELVWTSWSAWNRARLQVGREFNPRHIVKGLAFAAERWQQEVDSQTERPASLASGVREWAARTLPMGGHACGGLAVQVTD